MDWINDELAGYRILVKDLEEDLFDGQILQKLIGKKYKFNWLRSSGKKILTQVQVYPYRAGAACVFKQIVNQINSTQIAKMFLW